MSCPVKSRKVQVLDGGFSTQLSIHLGNNNKIDGDPLWTARFLATDRQAVLATHLDFLRAGADMIQTNTYQASIDGFTKYLGMTEEESLELIYDAVKIAKEAMKLYAAESASASGRLIVGSVGSYGAAQHDCSEYTGIYDPAVTSEMIKTWHKPRLEALIKGGVDLLALETIPNEYEARALIELLREYPQIQAWLSFSCREDGKSLVDGTDFRKVAVECYESSLPGQLIAVGVNCLAPRFVTPLLKSINKNKTNDDLLPLVVYPNSGEQYTVSEGWTKKDMCDPLENFVDEWLDLGVRYIGGCCRTGAKELVKIREAVQRWELKHSQSSE